MKCVSDFKRARQPQQIEQRRQDILHAAAILMAKQGFDQVSLNGIARKVGVAKSNVYRYFESKEHIFLQLLKQDWEAWQQHLQGKIDSLAGSNDIEALAELLAQSLAEFPRMCELMSVLASVLEQNLSEQALLEFKLESMQLAVGIVAQIHRVLPTVKQEKLLLLTETLIALVAGLWPLGNPSPLVQKVMEHPQLQPFQMEFKSSLQRSLILVLQGASQQA